MKIGICVSNEYPKVKNSILKVLQSKFKKEFGDWSLKFATFMDQKGINYDFVNIDEDNWIEKIDKFDILIWKPQFMGISSSQFFKEKVYFIQHIMKKRIYPNYETVWHFDSKIAQKYIFEYQKIKTPKTFASFSYNECIEIANNLQYPVVYKKSNGAGSSNVKLVKSKKALIRKINNNFLWNRVINALLRKKVKDPFGYLYFQEFIKGNFSDLRVNIIGDKYGFGFYRFNRKNDFRASGSGKIDYNQLIPHEILEYCLDISKKNKFDSMAYDILFTEDGFVIVEMSYGYSDIAVYNSKGYYIFDKKGKISSFVEGHFWPQELWIQWLIEDSKILV